MAAAPPALLEVDGLTVDYWGGDRWVNVVDGVSFTLGAAEVLGLAGESGCGKSTVAAAILGERRPNSRIREGRVVLQGTDLLKLGETALQPIRGKRVSFVPQNPGSSLTPSMSIGHQITETLEAHSMAHGRAAEDRAFALLADVGLPDSAETLRKLPHELSGGQQQRVVIALALACQPTLVVLDEPTTGLDVTTQRRILDLLSELRERLGLAMLYISHDLAALSLICTRIAVMYAGHLMETRGTEDLFDAPRHPYTEGLIASVPRLDRPPDEQAALAGVLRREALPPGCRFAPRCRHAVAPRCFEERQTLESVGPREQVACWRWRELRAMEAAQ